MLTSFRLSRSFKTAVQPTPNVQAVAAMFGIGIDEDIEIALYHHLEVKLGPGQVVYITGDSGAGKSCLLRDLRDRIGMHKDFAAVPDPVAKDAPLIDQFDDWSIQETADLLNYVGLSEAFVYLRRPAELSDGQRYRFNLAKHVHWARGHARANPGVTPVLFSDEFLAPLDREVAKNIAYQIRRVATRFKLCFVVATTHSDMVADLQPNLTVTLRLNLPPELVARPLAGL